MKKIFLVLLVIVAACGKDATKQTIAEQTSLHEGIEECSNGDGSVRGVAHQMIGPAWEYTYKGEKYRGSFADWSTGSSCAVEHVSEKIHSYTCKNGEIVNRQSVRRVILRDQNCQTILDAELFCEGSFSNGIYPMKGLPVPSCK